MSNDYYNPSGSPSTGAAGSSAAMRSEFLAVQAGFDRLPTMTAHGSEFVRVNAGGTALESLTASQVRSALTLVIGTDVQAWDADLDALAALDSTVGLLIKTAAATYARRSVIGTANELTVTNGNGAAGNITVSLPSSLTFTGKTVQNGTFNNVALTSPTMTGSPVAPTAGAGTNNTQVATTGFVTSAIALAATPTGAMADFAGTAAPTGWLLCDGNAVSRTTYNALFTAIGTTWGAGDGANTFNVPNFARRVSVGSGGSGTATLANTVGSTGGTETHTLTTAEMPAHNHIQKVCVNSTTGGGTETKGVGDSTGLSNSGQTTVDTGGGGAHNNLQPSAVVLKIIKT